MKRLLLGLSLLSLLSVPQAWSMDTELTRELKRTLIRRGQAGREYSRVAYQEENYNQNGDYTGLTERALKALKDLDQHIIELQALTGLSDAELSRLKTQFSAPGLSSRDV